MATPPYIDPEEPFFSSEEYDRRVGRAREEMARRGLTALLVVSPESIYYLTGLNHQGHFAFTMLVLPLEGTPLLVARALEGVTIAAQVPQCRHVAFADYEDPAEIAAQAVFAAAPPGAVLAVEQSSMCFPLSVWEPLRAELREFDVVDGSGIVEQLRQVKSSA